MKRREALFLACLAAPCLAALGGCKLIDQNTFAPSPEVPIQKTGPAAVMPSADKRTPLLSVGFGTPDPHYDQLLAYAMQQARDRRPNAAFDVVSVVPQTGDTVEQALAASHGASDAAQVMQSMIGLGIPDTRIHLGTRTEPGLSERQVRVYIR